MTMRAGPKRILSLLVVAAFSAGCLTMPTEEPHPHMDNHGADAKDHGSHTLEHVAHHEAPLLDPHKPPDLSHEPPFPLEEGERPSLETAKTFAKKYSRFIAKGDTGIAKLRAEGHLTGNGTPDSPYVLEDFYVDDQLSLTSLDKSIILRNGYVAGQLKLNYVGESLYVHHVYAKDLRVNENVKRNGTNTGGLFHDNHFAFVGQLRHFTGEFRDNKVGPKPTDAIADSLGDSGVVKVANEVVLNLDGFHGADVHHNDILGQVDIKLHGHNHADCFTCPVHDHTDPHDTGHEDHMVAPNPHGFTSIHQVRHTSLLFRDNTITVPGGTALRYNDRNHAGDDRTATSEPHDRLNDPHIHYQDITIQKNKLVGGQLLIDIFNAPEDRHPAQNRGVLRVWHNDIRIDYNPPTATRNAPSLVHGVRLVRVDGLELDARGNTIQFREVRSNAPGDELLRLAAPKMELRGFQIETVDASNLTIAQSHVRTGQLGVWAQGLTATTHWRLVDNQFLTQQAWRGKDIANPPKES